MIKYKDLPVFELVVPEEEMGVYAISLVDRPATETEWLAFSEDKFQDTYNDYPQQAIDNAKKGIELNEAVDNDCATAVGKQRAQDIANKRGLSFDVIKRTFSYLSRAEEYYDASDEEACGTISFLLWGGKSMKSWCEKKIEDIEKEMMGKDKKASELKFSVNSDKQILTAPLMLANTPIYRNDKFNGEHYIVFTEETLEKMSINFFKNNVRDFNEMHNSSFGIDNATVIESWIKTSENDKSVDLGFSDAPVGSWFISVFIDDTKFWNEKIKSGEFKGFSLEGFFEKVQLSSDEEAEAPSTTGEEVDETEEVNDFINKLSELANSDIDKAQLLDEIKKML